MTADATQRKPSPPSRKESFSHITHWHPHIDFSNLLPHRPGQAKISPVPCHAPAQSPPVSPGHPQRHNSWHLPQFALTHSYTEIASPTSAASTWTWFPRSNVAKTDDAYVIELELPGVHQGEEDQVRVIWTNPRTVMIYGEVPESKIETNHENVHQQNGNGEGDGHKKMYLLKERHEGHWRRSFTLPEDAEVEPESTLFLGDEGRLKCRIEAGLVFVTIPRTAKS